MQEVCRIYAGDMREICGRHAGKGYAYVITCEEKRMLRWGCPFLASPHALQKKRTDCTSPYLPPRTFTSEPSSGCRNDVDFLPKVAPNGRYR